MEGVTVPHPPWRLLVEKYSGSEFGVILEHKDLALAMSCKYPSLVYWHNITRWQRVMLREHHKAIKCLRGTGYQIVRPDEYTEQSRHVFLAGRRRIKKSALIAAVAPVEQMSQAQSTKHASHLAWFAPLMSVLSKIERNTRPALLGKTRPDFPRLAAKNEKEKSS